MEEKIETKEEQVQKPKRKKMDPNDKKTIFCSLVILTLIIVPLVLAKALQNRKQEDENPYLYQVQILVHNNLA